jgi:Domain of unknown function (DUF4398)
MLSCDAIRKRLWFANAPILSSQPIRLCAGSTLLDETYSCHAVLGSSTLCAEYNKEQPMTPNSLPSQSPRMPGSMRRIALAAVCMLTFAACASAPKAPLQALQAAEMAITSAEQARVADYASPELTDARQDLSAARKAVTREDMVLAERLAKQSRVNAELAMAKTEAIKAKAVNDEMMESTEALKQEMLRNSGAQK